MFDEAKFDWEVREDARTLTRAKAIENDPMRLRKAQECIREEAKANLRALGVEVPPPASGRKNPATIMQLEAVRK